MNPRDGWSRRWGTGSSPISSLTLAAVVAAFDIHKRMEEYSAMRMGQEKFKARIGLNTGSGDPQGQGHLRRGGERRIPHAEQGKPRGHVRDRGDIPGDQGLRALHPLGKIDVKGIKDPMMAYSPQ